MSRKKAASSAPPKISLLPLPEPLLKHHRPALESLLARVHDTGKLGPVLLFTGPSGIGKQALLHYLSQTLLCDSGSDSSLAEEGSLFAPSEPITMETTSAGPPLSPCGECANCRRALSGNWLDFQEISPTQEEGESKGPLKIEQFRDLKLGQGHGAFNARYKIILINEAERMTVQAANSLLKILEEPPPGWLFFLTASDASLLISTLVSRCQMVKLKPLSIETIEELLLLSKVPAERARIAARLANGSFGKALRASGDDFWERRQSILRFLESPSSEVGPLLDWSAQNTEHLEHLADHLEQLAHDLLRSCLNEAGSPLPWINQDAASVLERHRKRIVRECGSIGAAREFWQTRIDRLFAARSQFQTPMNKKLLAQDLLFPWLATRSEEPRA